MAAMTHRNYADQRWAKYPLSLEGMAAAAKEFKHHCPEPRVKISSAVPVKPIVFERKMK